MSSTATWPTECAWEVLGDGTFPSKLCRSDDGRVVIRATLRFGVPETWDVLVIVYAEGGASSERLGWFEMTIQARFDEAISLSKSAVLASGLAATEKGSQCFLPPVSGRLLHDENTKKQHQIPLGSIVEVEVDMDAGWGPYEIAKNDGNEICIGIVGKVRMYVVKHSRDYDGTPLYSIASKPIVPPDDVGERLKYDAMVRFCMHGIDEESMKVVVDGKHVEVRMWPCRGCKEEVKP